MTSELAKADLEDLRAEGLTPTDDDIIRLHALALEITNGSETTAANTPRWATAGGVVFWEPTMAARFWYEYAKNYADDEETDDWLFAFACAKGRDPKFLDDLHDPEEIECALGCFLSSITATKDEVERAVYYATVGPDYIEAEPTELAKKRSAEHGERERKNLEAIEGLLENAAAATGLTYNDLLAQTPSRLRGMIYAAHIQAGMTMTKSSAKAHAAYLATLDAISKRLRAEKEARAADAAAAT